MFQADSHIHKIQELEHGTARLDALDEAIRDADSAADHYWRIYFRFEYVKESVFHDDNFKAIIMFPQLLQIFDEHPELEDDTFEDIMQAFKWVLENMPDYHQISKAEIDQYYEEYERRCRRYGYSLRVYYMKKCKYALTYDQDEARALYDKFHECRRDGNSDCEACEIHFDMTVAMELGDLEEAMRIGAPLFNGTKRCAEVPHVTYGRLCRHFLYAGNLQEAEYYGKLCEKYTKGEPEFLMETGYLLELWSCIRPAYGWKILKNNIEYFVKSKNPMMRMAFARGAARLLRQIAKETDSVGSVLLAPLPVKAGEEGYAISELIDYFHGLASEQSSLLDARNGSSYYTDILNTELPDAPARDEETPDTAEGSVHGLVTKQPSGLMLIPEEGPIPTIQTLDKKFDNAPEGVEVLSHSTEGEMLFATIRFNGEVYEILATWMPVSEPLQAFPCYGMPEELFDKVRTAKHTLLLHMDLNDHVLQSYHLQMKLAWFLLPGMVGALNLHTTKLFPGYWVEFAAAFPSAVTPEDLIRLHISGCEESDEIWMTTTGMSCLGLREMELIGANRENFGYFADLLHYNACMRIENNMLPDAGQIFGSVSIGEQNIAMTWALPETVVQEGTLASRIEREIPSAVLMVQPDDEGDPVSPTAYAPMLLGNEIEFPNSQMNFVRRIYLAKETFGCFCNALQVPYTESAVRVEFELSPEMRQRSGYSRELLWAENVRFDNGKITAVIAETSELLPDYEEGDEITVTPDNITSWFIRPTGSDRAFTEQDAFAFL